MTTRLSKFELKHKRISAAISVFFAVRRNDSPSIMALIRQNLPGLRDAVSNNQSMHGGYILSPGEGSNDIVLMATCSEVHLAVQSQKELLSDGISARTVSSPCMEIFLEQGEIYVRSVLCEDLPKVVVEAGVYQRWSDVIGNEDGLLV